MASTENSKTEVLIHVGQERSALATTSSKQDGSRVSCPKGSDPAISVQHTDITSVACGVFPCVLCSESFTDGLALAVHERSHSQSPALCCPVCDRSFSLPGDLHRHRRRHERRGGIADNRSEAFDNDHVPIPLRSNEQGTQTTKVAQKSSITQVSVVSSADGSGVSTGIMSTGTAVARTVGDRPSEDKRCTSESVRAGGLTPPKKKHTKLMEKSRRLSEVSRASASDIDMQEGMSGNSTVSGTIESSEATNDALESPFQCAICRARFGHVTSLQKHVEGHVQTESRQPVKKGPPRRSQRSRPAKRRAGAGEAIDNGIDVGSEDAGSGGKNDGDVSVKPLDNPPVTKKRTGRVRKDPGRAAMSRSVKGGSKASAQTALSSTAEAGSVSNPESGTSASLELATSASEIQAAVSAQNSKEDVSAAQPAIEQSTATKFLQPSPRRRTSRAIIPLVMDEESYVDDAPAVSPRTQPPSALSGTAKGSLSSGLDGVATEAVASSTETPLSTPPPMSTEGSAVEGQEATTSSEAEALALVKCPDVPGQFKCDVCGRRLAHRHALARHRRLHFARENFQCDKCPRRYSRFDSLVTHSRKHATEATHKCQICSKAYRLRCLLEYHQREHKNEDVPPAPVAETPRFECAECGKTFSFMTALRRHARLHLGAKHFFCELCPKRYSRFDALVLHARAHSLLTPFECVICARSFSQRQILEYHVRAHAGAVDGAYPPFNCTMCGRSFPDVAQLREHRLRHSATRSYLCDMCGKAFKSANKLRRHVMTHTGERPLTCKVCERRFVDSTSLTQHMRIHSGERPFQCHVCGKSFSRNVTLKIHGRTHSGERPYPCEICGRAFTTVTQLRRHGRVHSGERPYICTVCGRAFSQATHRKVHMRTHAPRPDDAVDGQQPLLWLQQPLPAALQQPQQQQEQQQSQQQQQQSQQQQQQEQQEEQLHQQQEKQQQLTAPATGHQQHQQSQEHSQLYTLQEGLQAVAPLQLEEGNVPLHFLEH